MPARRLSKKTPFFVAQEAISAILGLRRGLANLLHYSFSGVIS